MSAIRKQRKSTAPTYVKNISLTDVIIAKASQWTSQDDKSGYTSGIYLFSKSLQIQSPWFRCKSGTFTANESSRPSVSVQINDKVQFGNNINKANRNAEHTNEFILFIDALQYHLIQLFREQLLTAYGYVTGADMAVSGIYKPGYSATQSDELRFSCDKNAKILARTRKRNIDGSPEDYTYTELTSVPPCSTIKTLFTIVSIHLIDNKFIFTLRPNVIIVEQSHLQTKRIPGFHKTLVSEPQTTVFG